MEDINSKRPRLYVSFDQYFQIKDLEFACRFYDIDGNDKFDDGKWISGLEKISVNHRSH